MLHFDSKPHRRPPGRLSRGLQLRLVTLVVGLGFVLATMNHLRTPEGAAAVGRLLRGGAAPIAEAETPVEELPPPLLDAERLAMIEDNTFFRGEETNAWFALFAALRDADLGGSAPGPFTYAQLTRQPHVYRGRPLRVAGTLRRVEQTPAGDNDLGIESLHRLVVQGQGGEVWPTTLYTLEPPAGVPVDEAVDLPVEATGVFFKNWSYRWRNGLGISPVFLAKNVRVLVEPVPAPTPTNNLAPRWVVLIAAAIAGVVLLMLWLRAPRRQTAASPQSPRPDFSRLAAEQGDA